MRTLLLLAALAVSCCALQPGLEYQYRYSGQVASGIPEIQSQFAAAGIEADVILQVIDPTIIKAKFINVQSGVLNEVVKGTLRDPLAFPFAPVQEAAAILARPFTINVVGGELASLEVTAGEPVWVTNIRRSVINILRIEHLKVNLAGAGGVASQNTIQAQTPFADGPVLVKEGESSVFGKCSTLYKMTALPEDLSAKEAYVTKNTITQDVQATAATPALSTKYWIMKRTVDFNQCEKNIHLKRDGTPMSCKPGELMCEPKIERSSIGNYVIRGGSNSIRIERAVIEGSVIFHAMDVNFERIQTFTNQNLILKAVRAIGQQMAVKTPAAIIDSFHFEFKPAAKGQDGAVRQPLIEEYVSAIELQPGDFAAAKAGIVKAIKELVTFVSTKPTTNSIHEEHARRLHVTGKAVSLLSKTDLQAIHNEIVHSGSPELDSVPMKTFAQILMISGSDPAVRFLMELIESAPTAQRNYILLDFTTSILDVRTPVVLKSIMEFVLNKLSMTREPVYKSSALMNFATLFQRLCVKPKTTFVHTPICNAETLLDTFIPAIAREIESETEEWKKIAYVQALLNLGHPKVLKVVKPIALGQKTTDSRVRNVALWAFAGSNMNKEVKDEAMKTLHAIFENYNENYEVRSQAFLVLLTWGPSQVLLQQVATSTWREPSNQVAALITHTLITLARTNGHWGQMAARVLPLAKPAPVASLVTSFYKDIVMYIYKAPPVAWGKIVMLANTNGVFPRQLSIMMHTSVLDVDNFAIDFQWGAQILGADEMFKNVAALIKLRFADANIQRGAMQVAKELYSQIKEKVGAHMKAAPKKMEILIWSQFFRTYQLLLPVIADLESIVENSMSVLAKLEKTVHFQYQLFKEPVILETAFPTELGLPHLVQLATPTINYIVGSIKLQVSGHAEGKIDSIKMDIDLTIVQNSKMQVLAKTVLPWARTAAAVGVDHVKAITLPIAGNVLVDIKEAKMNLTVKPKGDKVELLGVKNVPFTGIIGALPLFHIQGFEIKPIQALETPFYTNNGVLADMGLTVKYVWEGDIQNQLNVGNIFTKVTSMRPFPFPIPTASAIIPNTAKFWTMKVILDVTASANKAIALTVAYDPVVKSSSSSIQPLSQYDQVSKVNQIQQNYMANLAGKIHSIHCAVEFVGSASTRYEAVISIGGPVAPVAGTSITVLQVSLTNGAANAVCLNIEAVAPQMLPLTQYKAVIEGHMKTTLKIAASMGANCHVTPDVAKMNAEFWMSDISKARSMLEFHPRAHVSDSMVERVLAPFIFYDQYKAAVSWTEALPSTLYTPAHLAYDMVIALNFPDMYNTYQVNPTNQVTIQGHKNEKSSTWISEIKAPIFTAFWEHALGPAFNWALHLTNHHIAPRSIIPVFDDAIHPGFRGWRNVQPVACSIFQHSAETFDGVSIPITPTSCWSVAAMSLTNDPMPFVVQVKTKDVPTVRVVLPAEGVIIQATAQQEIKVNGKPVVIVGVGRSTPLSELSYAYKLPDSGIIIKAGNGVAVKVANDHMHVSAPSLYRGQVGGLCGDNNGESTSDLVGPKGCVYNKAAHFNAAWAVPEGGCDHGAIQILKEEVTGFQAKCPRHHVIA